MSVKSKSEKQQSAEANRRRWFTHIEEQITNQLSQAAYCRHHRLNADLFAYYRKQYFKKHGHPKPSPHFQAVQVTPMAMSSSLELSLNHSHILKIPRDYPTDKLATLLKQIGENR